MSIPSYHLMATWISSGSRWSPRPGDGVANSHEDACAEDTDRSLALSVADLHAIEKLMELCYLQFGRKKMML